MNIPEQFLNVSELVPAPIFIVSEQFQNILELIPLPSDKDPISSCNPYTGRKAVYGLIKEKVDPIQPPRADLIRKRSTPEFNSIEIGKMPQGNPRNCPGDSLGLPRGINLRTINLLIIKNLGANSEVIL